MNWKEIYADKITDAKTALQLVNDNDRIVVSSLASTPKILMEALADRIKELSHVYLASLFFPHKDIPILREDVVKNISYYTTYAGAGTRELLFYGNGQYIPSFLKDFPYVMSEVFKPNVAVISITPPDKHGYCSIGPEVLHMLSAIDYAKTVIAEVNDRLPRTHGNSFVHISKINCLVECSHELPVVQPADITDVEKRIGENVASFINDGDCLQLGIGSIPNATLNALRDKNDLGIHTEMFSDGIVNLSVAGNINGKRKNIDNGKIVTTFVTGTRKVYDFIDDNPVVMFQPSSYTNNPFIISQNDNVVSVNSCIEVDLMGQAASEAIGLKQYSGVGGQVDFFRGASASKGGRTILAMPSTTANGKFSKIVPLFKEGTIVSTDRNEYDCVVTEYGIAKIRNCTLRERAENLIRIAHPNFRDMLRDKLKELNW